jgi:hypothetical protein
MWFAYLSRSDPGLRGNDLDFATYRKNPQSSESFQVLSENAKTCFLLRTLRQISNYRKKIFFL